MIRQLGVRGSSLELYRTLLRIRRDLDLGVGELTWESLGEDVVAFRVTGQDGAGVRVISNLGAEPVPVPQGADVLVVSSALTAGTVPTDTTIWLRLGA